MHVNRGEFQKLEIQVSDKKLEYGFSGIPVGHRHNTHLFDEELISVHSYVNDLLARKLFSFSSRGLKFIDLCFLVFILCDLFYSNFLRTILSFALIPMFCFPY